MFSFSTHSLAFLVLSKFKKVFDLLKAQWQQYLYEKAHSVFVSERQIGALWVLKKSVSMKYYSSHSGIMQHVTTTLGTDIMLSSPSTQNGLHGLFVCFCAFLSWLIKFCLSGLILFHLLFNERRKNILGGRIWNDFMEGEEYDQILWNEFLKKIKWNKNLLCTNLKRAKILQLYRKYKNNTIHFSFYGCFPLSHISF